MNRVEITRSFAGIFHMQVCAVADATDEEILETCNRENPSGTRGGWSRIEREGPRSPIPCIDHPERTHYLVSC